MIPIHRVVVSDYSKKLVNEVLDSGNLVQGKMVKRFEEEFAEISGAKYAAATSNGTTSLELMMRADGVDEDYVVFTNPLSFAATPRAIRHVGA
ncbi:MAG: DegT/DnrJ/EryC1/StrS family aminotransferase, partial [Acidimicrobiia bacterium]